MENRSKSLPLYLNLEGVKTYIEMVEGENAQFIIEQLNKYLKRGSRILEIGMGAGNDLNILKEDYVTTGSDYSQYFIDEYQNNFPNADLIRLDAISLKTKRIFDCIFSNKVLHHLTKHQLTASLDHQYRLLSKKGIICHSFWKGSRRDFSKGLHFNHYFEEELEEIFNKLFNIEFLNSYGDFGGGESILLIASKK